MAYGADAGRATEAAEVVRALVSLRDLDLLYADRYRDRAQARLAPLCSRHHLAELTDDATALGQLSESMRRAAERAEWPLVRLLARRSTALRTRVEGERELRALGEEVYREDAVALRTPALALGGVLDPRTAEKERFALEGQLRFLSEHDPEWQAFYRERLSHFAEPGSRQPHARAPRDGAENEALRQAVLAAIGRADFADIERLLDGALTRQPARVEATAPRTPRHIDRPFDGAVVHEAEALGLEPVTLAAEPDLTRCLASWCRWEPDGGDVPLRSERSSCGRRCPVLGRQALWESLNLLVVRPFATSAGTPYLPRFDAESMLVERFPEDAPDGPSPLLTLLELPRRRGFSRAALETAVRQGAARVCTALGLDPFEFTLAAIPFDAYLRLAPQRGWGRQPLWTHFDGYQVSAGHTLRALVGGDRRYGGTDGLYGVGRYYDGDHLLARFAVLHRQRFL